MEHFLQINQIKMLHWASTVLLFAGLFGLSFYAWRSGDVERIAHSFKHVRLIGWPLFAGSLLILPISGWWLAYLIGWPLGQTWLLFSTGFYLLGCIFWLLLARRLARVHQQARSRC